MIAPPFHVEFREFDEYLRRPAGHDHQGQKLRTLLLADALHHSWRASAQIASVGVVAEAINDGARAFYLHHEFMPLPDHSRKLFMPMQTIATAFGSP
jgi:hypothetical protein